MVQEGFEFMESAKSKGMEEATIKIGKYCLKKYLNGERTMYNWKSAFDAFIVLVEKNKLKHFYDFFCIIRDDDKESLETLLVAFISDVRNFLRNDISIFLSNECYRRGFSDLEDYCFFSKSDYLQ